LVLGSDLVACPVVDVIEANVVACGPTRASISAGSWLLPWISRDARRSPDAPTSLHSMSTGQAEVSLYITGCANLWHIFVVAPARFQGVQITESMLEIR
jgi:hypothetical protein